MEAYFQMMITKENNEDDGIASNDDESHDGNYMRNDENDIHYDDDEDYK